MKKNLLIMLISFNCVASQPSLKQANESVKPWSLEATSRLKKGLEGTLDLARKQVQNYKANGVYKVCLIMHEQLAKAAPHQLPCSSLSRQFLKELSTNSEKYKNALASAKQNNSEFAWKAFRQTAAQILTEHVESQSTKLKFNRGQENLKDIFTKNPELDLESQDGKNLAAATLSLYALWDVQENARKEIK